MLIMQLTAILHAILRGVYVMSRPVLCQFETQKNILFHSYLLLTFLLLKCFAIFSRVKPFLDERQKYVIWKLFNLKFYQISFVLKEY